MLFRENPCIICNILLLCHIQKRDMTFNTNHHWFKKAGTVGHSCAAVNNALEGTVTFVKHLFSHSVGLGRPGSVCRVWLEYRVRFSHIIISQTRNTLYTLAPCVSRGGERRGHDVCCCMECMRSKFIGGFICWHSSLWAAACSPRAVTCDWVSFCV